MVMTEIAGKPISIVLSAEEYDKPAKPRQPRESGAGIDVDVLMAVPIDDMFADYMPEEK